MRLLMSVSSSESFLLKKKYCELFSIPFEHRSWPIKRPAHMGEGCKYGT